MIKKTVFPEDPADRLDFVLNAVFGNSPTALAAAAGVSRAAVNKWPPKGTAAGALLDEHLLRAINYEIELAEERVKMLYSMKFALQERRRRWNDDVEAQLRKARHDAAEKRR